MGLPALDHLPVNLVLMIAKPDRHIDEAESGGSNDLAT